MVWFEKYKKVYNIFGLAIWKTFLRDQQETRIFYVILSMQGAKLYDSSTFVYLANYSDDTN